VKISKKDLVENIYKLTPFLCDFAHIDGHKNISIFVHLMCDIYTMTKKVVKNWKMTMKFVKLICETHDFSKNKKNIYIIKKDVLMLQHQNVIFIRDKKNALCFFQVGVCTFS
jgi:hypothetical protein